MKHPKLILIIVLFSVLGLTACNPQTSAPNEHPIISPYSAAWNDQDLESMASLMHEDIAWMSVEGDAIKIEISGKEAMVAEMKSWFEGGNLPRGSLRDWSVNGNYVAVTETASWTTKDGENKSQSALTVYELEDNLIRRVYYYPSS
jgi:hypothetical protein